MSANTVRPRSLEPSGPRDNDDDDDDDDDADDEFPAPNLHERWLLDQQAW